MAVDPSGQWLKTSPKMRGPLARLSWDAECAWWKLYLYAADVGNDGRIPLTELWVAMDRKISQAKARKLVDELVAAEFVTLDGQVVVIDWKDQPLAEVWKDPIQRERWLRKKRLYNDGDLCKRIRDRDRNLCRYCGIRVNWKDKVSKTGGTYDHVDPDGPNSLENVVVSCRQCNGRKKDRTPEQWIESDPRRGRTLLRPGTTNAQAEAATTDASAPVDHGSTMGQPDADPGPTRPLRAPARPDRANPGPTPGQPAAGDHLAGPSRARDAEGVTDITQSPAAQEPF